MWCVKALLGNTPAGYLLSCPDMIATCPDMIATYPDMIAMYLQKRPGSRTAFLSTMGCMWKKLNQILRDLESPPISIPEQIMSWLIVGITDFFFFWLLRFIYLFFFCWGRITNWKSYKARNPSRLYCCTNHSDGCFVKGKNPDMGTLVAEMYNMDLVSSSAHRYCSSRCVQLGEGFELWKQSCIVLPEPQLKIQVCA